MSKSHCGTVSLVVLTFTDNCFTNSVNVQEPALASNDDAADLTIQCRFLWGQQKSISIILSQTVIILYYRGSTIGQALNVLPLFGIC